MLYDDDDSDVEVVGSGSETDAEDEQTWRECDTARAAAASTPFEYRVISEQYVRELQVRASVHAMHVDHAVHMPWHATATTILTSVP